MKVAQYRKTQNPQNVFQGISFYNDIYRIIYTDILLFIQIIFYC